MKINLRGATLDDCTFLYECRNDEEARKNARNTEEIDYSTHEAWVKKIVGGYFGGVVYIGEDKNQRIGIVRFTSDIPPEIAIHLHPTKRGQGYGTVLLQQAIKDFTEKNLEQRMLMATIRPSNKGSIRIFEKAGFKATGEKDPKDNGFDVYLLDVKR